MKCVLVVFATLFVSGCVGDGLSSPKTAVSPDLDNPKQVCESTMIGSEPKTVCY
jgi:hypothetical protein